MYIGYRQQLNQAYEAKKAMDEDPALTKQQAAEKYGTTTELITNEERQAAPPQNKVSSGYSPSNVNVGEMTPSAARAYNASQSAQQAKVSAATQAYLQRTPGFQGTVGVYDVSQGIGNPQKLGITTVTQSPSTKTVQQQYQEQVAIINSRPYTPEYRQALLRAAQQSYKEASASGGERVAYEMFNERKINMQYAYENRRRENGNLYSQFRDGNSNVLSNHNTNLSSEETKRKARLAEYERKIAARQEADRKFYNSEGFKRVDTLASLMTFGGGKPIENRTWFGYQSETLLGGLMKSPIYTGGYAASVAGKLGVAAQGLTMKETRPFVLREFGRAGVETAKIYDPRTREGQSTYIQAALFALPGAALKTVKSRAVVTTKGEQIASMQTEKGSVTLLESGGKVKVGGKTYDISAAGKEYALRMKDNVDAVFGKYKFEAKGAKAEQLVRGARINTETGSQTISEFFTKIDQGKKVSYQAGKQRTITDNVITDEYGLTSEAAMTLTKTSKVMKGTPTTPLEKVMDLNKKTKPSAAEVGMVREMAKIDEVTYGKGKFVELSGEKSLNQFMAGVKNAKQQAKVRAAESQNPYYQQSVNLVRNSQARVQSQVREGVRQLGQSMYQMQVVKPTQVMGTTFGSIKGLRQQFDELPSIIQVRKSNASSVQKSAATKTILSDYSLPKVPQQQNRSIVDVAYASAFKPASKQTSKTESKTKDELKIQQKPFIIQEQAQNQAQEAQLKVEQKQAQLQKQKQQQKLQLKQLSKLASSGRGRFNFEFEPPPLRVPGALPSWQKKNKNLEKSFSTYVRRKGQWEQISKEKPFGFAKMTGAKAVASDLSASFKVMEDGWTSLSDNSYNVPQNIFREYKIVKGQRVMTPGLFIQKTSQEGGSPFGRLASPFERGEIQTARKKKASWWKDFK